MELIPSFSVDHTRIIPGIYESRVDTINDAVVTTFDVRMKTPNAEPAIAPAAMHTIEHVVATYLRNHPAWKDKLVYWGPMGCLTGFYIIVKGRPAASEMYPILLEAFRHMSEYEGEVPGATPKNCGNYLMHDLPMAKWEAKRYVEYLMNADKEKIFEYPQTERLTVEGNQSFFDS
ncbi:MAG: S-ribosylhomocysteine lyase [Clostridia bacterium]|nr:S-ribosylhomocysteine lyase [Clostridia bacterium]MBR0407299.1 S-ribosylhomocysteine lyase [Clostridia bacterium]